MRTLEVAISELPTPWGVFQLRVYRSRQGGSEHLVLVRGNVGDGTPVLTRLHSECLTGDALSSLRCDCGAQLKVALGRIGATKRGVLIYLRQEGRGIGLFNKVRAYELQDRGADTVEANHRLGFGADLRSYEICREIFEDLGVRCVRLMTNNPGKVRALQGIGISVVERVALVVGETSANRSYLEAKAAKMGHLLQSEAPHADALGNAVVESVWD